MSSKITIGYSTRTSNPQFVEYLKKSSGFKKLNVIEKVNNGEKSLSQVYNEILEESETDIVILCHDDIYFDTSSWYGKIISHFEKTDYGILGVAGTTYMPKSGQWWEQRKKMCGIVNHEHQGKKWENKYSESLGKNIKETVIVDGLFIALSKSRIKYKFDEKVPGFHFYDLNFCFPNYLDGVKVGVLFDIRITHKSIGITNESWEQNRISFSEKFSSELPQVIPVNDKDKIKVLLSCLQFANYTGSEMYVFELAKNLLNLNCEVSVLSSNINGPLSSEAQKLGIKVYDFNSPPHYKLGDGIFGVTLPNGQKVISEKNKFYLVSEPKFDIIHTQHKPISEFVCNLYPYTPKISTIHSEVIDLENPHIHESIKSYITIRPEIKEYIVNNFGIDESIVDVIYNPVDSDKFKPTNTEPENSLLFVGTIDYLRENTIRDLVEYTSEKNMEFWIVGENKSDYLDELTSNSHVKYFKPTLNTETFINKSKETAGILLGRTTIESWMCSKPSWIYNVDNQGNIIDKKLYEVPLDLEKFKSSEVSKQIKKKYLEVINSI